MKPAGQGDEAYQHDDLDDKGGFEEVPAQLLLAGRDFYVCPVADTISIQSLDYGGNTSEGGEDAAWVEGRVVWDVVEEATKDLVIAHFVEGSSSVNMSQGSRNIPRRVGETHGTE